MEHLITQKIIGAAIEVHRRLGPGLLEATYEMCLAQEFKFQHILFERQRAYPLLYREAVLESAYRIDFLVENQAVETFSNIHVAQLLTYLRLLNLRKGLYPFRLKGTQENRIESSLKSNKKSRLILSQY